MHRTCLRMCKNILGSQWKKKIHVWYGLKAQYFPSSEVRTQRGWEILGTFLSKWNQTNCPVTKVTYIIKDWVSKRCLWCQSAENFFQNILKCGNRPKNLEFKDRRMYAKGLLSFISCWMRMSMAKLVPTLLSANLTQASPAKEAIQQCLTVLFPIFQLENLNWI